MNELWKRASLDPNTISNDELQMLLNDRLAFVTDNLSTINCQNIDETLFDLIMLCFDSLNEHRSTILKLWQSTQMNSQLLCKMQTQLIESIDIWHQELSINWQIGTYIQNTLFLLILFYISTIWKDDSSPDSSKVMAKTNEIIELLNQSKSAPFDLLQKLKALIV